MKIQSIISVTSVAAGYDVTIKTSSGNIAVAHTDEQWVIQSVSRIELNQDGAQIEVGTYSVIPQECRVAIQQIKDDEQIACSLLYHGTWYNK